MVANQSTPPPLPSRNGHDNRDSDAESSSPQILVVDSSPALREVLTDIFTHHGFTTTTCDAESDAFEALQSIPHHIAILAYHLPAMTGMDFITRMRESGHAIPTIILSSPRTQDREDDCLNRGASAFFVKPFRVDAIVQAVRQLLEQE